MIHRVFSSTLSSFKELRRQHEIAEKIETTRVVDRLGYIVIPTKCRCEKNFRQIV